MPRIVHFEIPADDIDRALEFYREIFGWQIKKFEGPSDYWLIQTEEGADVEGGLMKRQQPQQQMINYIDVPSIDEYTQKVKDRNGQVIVPKMAVPGQGYFAVCKDTEGNVFGLWKTDTDALFFSEPAEVFIAVLAVAIAADDRYSVDEMRTVWYEVEPLEIFKDRNFRELEFKVFNLFGRETAQPSAFSETEIDQITYSAQQMLSSELREQAFHIAVKLAHSDKTIDGYKLDISEREQMVLDRLQAGLGISQQTLLKIMDELSAQKD